MDHRKLFHVLVIGGALLGAGCTDATPPEVARDDASTGDPADAAARELADAATAGDDAGPPSADAAPAGDASASADAGELVECGFCPNDACCETDESGASRTREGMMCCWSTSC